MAKRNPVCPFCKVSFLPSSQNKNRQKYCNGSPECRAESHRQSQRRWCKKPENRDYYRGSDQVERVRQWRNAHPGYSRKRVSSDALHDDCSVNPVEEQAVTPVIEGDRGGVQQESSALHDFAFSQTSVLVGFISHLVGSTLHDDIAGMLRRMQELGDDVLHSTAGGSHAQTDSLSRTTPPDPVPVQLGRPPPGARPSY